MPNRIGPQFVLTLSGAAALVALAIRVLNPPLPDHFGGSFHPNIMDLSALADRIASGAGWLATVLLVIGLAWAILRHGFEAEGTSRSDAAEPDRP